MNRAADGRWRALAGRFSRFSVVGVLGFVVDAGLSLLQTQLWAVPALLARVPAFLTASAVTYYFNRRWSFRHEATGFLQGWLRYVAATGAGAGLNFIVYAGITAVFGAGAIAVTAGVAAGSIVALVFNFSVSALYVFPDPK